MNLNLLELRYIIPAAAVIALYALFWLLNKKGILKTYIASGSKRNLAFALLIVLFGVTSMNNQPLRDKYITAAVALLLAGYFIYRYFKTGKTA